MTEVKTWNPITHTPELVDATPDITEEIVGYTFAPVVLIPKIPGSLANGVDMFDTNQGTVMLDKNKKLMGFVGTFGPRGPCGSTGEYSTPSKPITSECKGTDFVTFN